MRTMSRVAVCFLAVTASAARLPAVTLQLDAGTTAFFQDGSFWVVETATPGVRGAVDSAAVASVKVNGLDATFEVATKAWQATLSLSAGRNAVVVEALDASSTVLETVSGTIDLLTADHRVQGELDADAVWSSARVVENPLVVPAGRALTIGAGVPVFIRPSDTITVRGKLLADGADGRPIRFTRYPGAASWGRILFLDAEDSRLSHCIVEFSNSAGEHQDYYGTGSRTYHEAVVAVSCHLDIEDCTFQNLPTAAAGGEGDAIAIMSDDPDLPGPGSANIRRCQFLRIGQGIHERFSFVLIEECYFTGKNGDNDDVDLWGESDPPPIVRNNRFINPAHDDMINPTRCSALIEGNILVGSDDHGLVLRDAGSPIVRNNVIYDCSAAGIAVENSCTATIVNNTIVNCGRGIRLFDLGRWDAPYYLNPGGGTAVVTNCIIRDCPQAMTLADSSNTSIADRGSHVTVSHCSIEGGQGAISVSGAQSTVTWGEGNIDVDPRFVDPAAYDFRLREGSPALDVGTSEGAPTQDLEGSPRPCGAGFDLGAYELCTEVPVEFVRGEVNSDGATDISDAVTILLYLFVGEASVPCLEAADADDDGQVVIGDAIWILRWLFLAGEAIAAPTPECGTDPTPDALGCEESPCP